MVTTPGEREGTRVAAVPEVSAWNKTGWAMMTVVAALSVELFSILPALFCRENIARDRRLLAVISNLWDAVSCNSMWGRTKETQWTLEIQPLKINLALSTESN